MPLSIAGKAENGPPAMQLLETTNNQGMGSGEWSGEQLPLLLMNALKKITLPTQKLNQEFENI